MEKDEAQATKEAKIAQAMKSECEEELAEAIPALESALTALDTIKPADIGVIKTMTNPPGGVKLVMAGVCVMLDIKPDKVPDPNGGPKKIIDYWGPSKKVLGDMGFLQRLKTYDKDHIPEAVMKKIRAEFKPNPDFDPERAKKSSNAAEGRLTFRVSNRDSYFFSIPIPTFIFSTRRQSRDLEIPTRDSRLVNHEL